MGLTAARNMALVWWDHPMFECAAASIMFLMLVKTGAFDRFFSRAYSEHLINIICLVMRIHPRSLIAAELGKSAFHPKIARAHVSCAVVNCFSTWPSIGQKTNRCFNALKTKDFYIIKSCGMSSMCLAANWISAHVRWLPIVRRALSSWVMFRLLCICNPK